MEKAFRTEDEVRDSAKLILGFDKTEVGVQQGTGQITTFNQLGFRGCNDKPDGWYLPDDASKPAIILETKSETEGVSKEKHVKELFKNIDVIAKKYSKTIGILYSGSAIRVFRNKIELSDASKRLENKDYYIRLCTSQKLDSNYIFEITQKINNSLHFKFGMTDLQDRMIFTACALVAQRYNPQNGLQKLKDMDYSTFHNWIYSALSKALEEDKKQNNKLDVLLEEYASVRMSITENQEAINDFIDNVCQIADLVNSDNWNGEDVMAIFFNEFNRYRGKAQAGQVFTPDHIAYDSIQITNIFAVIVLTQKTADIEEKQFQLLTNKKANIIIRHNVNLMEEMTLEGKSKAPIKIDISNCGNDTATNIAISINRIEIPQISFLLPNEIKSVYIGMVDISNHKITLVTGYEFPIEKSNALHMNIQEIKNTNNKWIIPIIITTDNK